MLFIKIRRIIKGGLINFWRNAWVSLATVLVMSLSLIVIGALVFSKVLLMASLEKIEEKVDVTVYFKSDAAETEILEIKDSLSKLDEVKDVEYISSDTALFAFKERHFNNSLIIQSLEELGTNPLGASLNIKAKNPAQYESIARFLESGAFATVDKVNYSQNKVVIDRLSGILGAVKTAGVGVSVALIFIAILVTFNTIRLAIYTNRDEITTMRLVGASNKYIRGPFVVEGIIYGFFSAVFTMALFYPLTFWLGSFTEQFFGGLNLYSYYEANFFELLFVLMGTGVFLGTFSGWFATRRYLRV